MGILVIRRNSACGVALPMSAVAFGAGDFVRLAGRSVQLTANLHPRVPEGLQRADTGLPTAPTCSASAKAPIETTIAIHRPGTDRLFRSSGSAFSAQKGHRVGVLRVASILGQLFSVIENDGASFCVTGRLTVEPSGDHPAARRPPHRVLWACSVADELRF